MYTGNLDGGNHSPREEVTIGEAAVLGVRHFSLARPLQFSDLTGPQLLIHRSSWGIDISRGPRHSRQLILNLLDVAQTAVMGIVVGVWTQQLEL